jgi:hypothetical protein
MLMSELANSIAKHTNVTQEEHIAAGQPVTGTVGSDHKEFLEVLFSLLASGEVDPYKPSSMLKTDVYDSLTEEKQDAVDMELQSICNQVRLIDNFRKGGCDATSIHFQTMVEQLWQMVDRIEIENDVFKF